jgi:signal transduction histidine kinase
MTSMRRVRAGVALAAIVIGVGTLLVVIHGEHNIHRGAYAALALGTGWGFIGTGLYAWRRRPGNNMGPLMIAVGFAGLLKALSFSNNSVIFTIGSLGDLLIYTLLIHLLLSFPLGRLDSQLDRALVAIAYFNTTVVQLGAFILNDPQQGCAQCPANPLLIDHADAAAGVIDAAQLDIAIAVLGAVVAILYRRWRDSSPSQRRSFAPVLAVGGLTFLLLMGSLIVEQASLSSNIGDGLTLALFGTLACLPFAFLTGLLRFRFNQAEAVSSLVARLGAVGRGSLRDALADALGDPEVELAYWVPNREAYVDAAGRPMQLDPAPRGKIATIIEHEGRRVGAIVHDADLAEERDLVRAVGATAALTLENERLDAELRAHVDELRASRSRIVTAGYTERQRLERDLHDGAQQRLMALGINLRMARGLVTSNVQDAVALLDASLEELHEATRELRELARGIHPAVLTDRGLEAALNGLAGRSPVPVVLVATPHERLPSSVESAVYFVVAEALTNVARYARAQGVRVTVVRSNGNVDVQVSDDGVGGADPAQGSGLRGLSDRVAALDGRLELTSADGSGTTVRARIPCG